MADGHVTGTKVFCECPQCGSVRVTQVKLGESTRRLCIKCSAKRAASASKRRHLEDYERRHGFPSPTVLGCKTGTKGFTPLYVVTCPVNGIPQRLDRRLNAACKCLACAQAQRQKASAYAKEWYVKNTRRFCGCGSVLSKYRRTCPLCANKAKAEQKRRQRASDAYRRSKKKHKVKTAAVKRGARFAESVLPKEIFARDGWCCTNCGCVTLESLIGTNSPNEPTLDHMIPVSRGGPHTRDNLQTLCRDCNVLKGTMTQCEFSLWCRKAA